MMSDENELVERLYRLHFKKLFIYANAVLRDPEQAKDVVQDTFMKPCAVSMCLQRMRTLAAG